MPIYLVSRGNILAEFSSQRAKRLELFDVWGLPSHDFENNIGVSRRCLARWIG